MGEGVGAGVGARVGVINRLRVRERVRVGVGVRVENFREEEGWGGVLGYWSSRVGVGVLWFLPRVWLLWVVAG